MKRTPSARIVFVTGTDTGVGKTVVTALLARALTARGGRVVALKPLSSGGRDDARALRSALPRPVALDVINPWHFRRAIAPVLAARSEGRRVRLTEAVRHVRACAGRGSVVLVEGAGGLLSPLGEDFDSRDLLAALRALPVIVAPNRLGAVNQVRLVWEALPRGRAREAVVVLLSPPRPDRSTRGNPGLLGEFVDAERLVVLPWLKAAEMAGTIRRAAVRRAMTRLVDRLELNDRV